MNDHTAVRAAISKMRHAAEELMTDAAIMENALAAEIKQSIPMEYTITTSEGTNEP